MQKSVQARKNRIISAMSGQFQSELPIFKTNRNTNRKPIGILQGKSLPRILRQNKYVTKRVTIQ